MEYPIGEFSKLTGLGIHTLRMDNSSVSYIASKKQANEFFSPSSCS